MKVIIFKVTIKFNSDCDIGWKGDHIEICHIDNYETLNGNKFVI
ncbi:hypothetical protein [Eubacterium sp. AF17-7]|nr:hypothetical protein [Eubacterium sp. AF17-7]